MRASRVLTSTGVRLAVLQTVLLIAVFWAAGSMTKFSVNLIYQHELHTRLLGEAAALAALDRAKGQGAVARAVTQDERRPGGLEYRLEDGHGHGLGGDLPPTGAPFAGAGGRDDDGDFKLCEMILLISSPEWGRLGDSWDCCAVADYFEGELSEDRQG